MSAWIFFVGAAVCIAFGIGFLNSVTFKQCSKVIDYKDFEWAADFMIIINSASCLAALASNVYNDFCLKR